MANFEADINLMPYLFYENLNLLELKNAKMTIHKADRYVSYPHGVIKKFLVKIGNFIFTNDFVVFEMTEDEEVPIILGCPILNTARALVNMCESKLTLRVGNEEITLGAK